MIYSSKFSALLDACVLYPAPVRDILLSFADKGLYKPKWSQIIQEEWANNLLKIRPDLTKKQVYKTIEAMNLAFPDANVENFENLINAISLPDKDDKHVVAAAIRCRADVIVTYNLKDFPPNSLLKFDIEAQHPDAFISNIIDLSPINALDAFKNLVKRLKNPPLDTAKVFDIYINLNLNMTVQKLKDLIQN